MTLYIYRNNQQLGPFDESYVKDELRNGNFSASDLACQEGSTDWIPLSTLFPAATQWREEHPQSSSSHSWNPPGGQSSPGYQQQQSSGNYYQTPQQSPQQPMTYQPVVPSYGHPAQSSSSLPKIGMSMGITVLCLMVLGLIPCLGWMNWIVLPVAGVTNIICLISIFTEQDLNARNKAIIGLVLGFIAAVIGAIRLIMGGGCI